jgi:ribosome-binding protein aMBF1 (putative translation factor)
MVITKSFLTLMKYERLKRGLSQQKLAFLAELQQTDVSKIENRRLVPGPRQAERIARALSIPVHRLQESLEIAETTD